ncbi:MAG TPA: ferric reductase-like transmembrane domain-containing protein [Candidatus Dormibacteraeota bacterium]|nr:ferric reductase-like transmembrane domain-containing protein [Candidatus Dormibacteraeota bacterium]
MTQPSPLWYAGRGAGMVLLLLLTATTVLGIATSQRWGTAGWPRFLTAGLHRNLALLSLVALPLHGLPMVLDRYAHLGLVDITVPFVSHYRPLWLGLGVLAGELSVAMVVTSLLRGRLGYRAWRLVHWLAYLAWPLAMLHGLGTGSDTRTGWALILYAACLVSVLLAILWRLSLTGEQARGWQAGMGALCGVGALALAVWTLVGPLQPGWAAAAGTPRELLGSQSASAQRATNAPSPSPTPAPSATPRPTTTPSPPPAASLPSGLDDRLTGSVTETDSGTEVDLVDLRDRSLELLLGIPGGDAATGPLTVTQGGQTICRTDAELTNPVTATCGGTQLAISLVRVRGGEGEGGRIVGVLQTGPSQ